MAPPADRFPARAPRFSLLPVQSAVEGGPCRPTADEDATFILRRPDLLPQQLLKRRNMPRYAQLLAHQHNALEAIKALLRGLHDCFILQAGAGMGKTSLMAALVGRRTKDNPSHAFLVATGVLAVSSERKPAPEPVLATFSRRANSRLRGGINQERRPICASASLSSRTTPSSHGMCDRREPYGSED